MLDVIPIPMRTDNYAWLLVDQATARTGLVDPAEAAPAAAILSRTGGRLDYILLTHHHDDHVGAAALLARDYGAVIIGAAADAHRLPKLDRAVGEGNAVEIGESDGVVMVTPGHTVGHICFYFARSQVLCCGDTLFSLGCGRLFEGTASMMFASLRRLASLPPETRVCCGHEYTEHNLAFALSRDPDNARLLARRKVVRARREAGQPTLPALLGDEILENPFLLAPNLEHFVNLRAARDRF